MKLSGLLWDDMDTQYVYKASVDFIITNGVKQSSVPAPGLSKLYMMYHKAQNMEEVLP